MDFVCVCVCVCVCEYYLTIDYPLPLHLRFATEWRVSDNHGRPWLVCVHGYTVIFLMCVHS